MYNGQIADSAMGGSVFQPPLDSERLERSIVCPILPVVGRGTDIWGVAMATDNNNVLRCASKWRMAGVGDIVNVYDLRVQEAVGVVADADVLEGVRNWFAQVYGFSDLNNLYHASVKHQEISVFNRTEDYPVGFVPRIPALDGIDSAEVAPETLAPLVIFRTPVSRMVGKKFLPPTSLGALDAGLYSAGSLSAMRDFADVVMVAQEAEADFFLQYVVTGVNPAPSYAPTSYAVRDVPAVLRRRKRGIGS